MSSREVVAKRGQLELTRDKTGHYFFEKPDSKKGLYFVELLILQALIAEGITHEFQRIFLKEKH